MTPIQVLFTILLASVVGLLTGWVGVGGFFLPMFFTGFLHMPVTESMSISFICFFFSGILSSAEYYKAKCLPLSPALFLSLGSVIGAAIGACLNSFIPRPTAKFMLYLVVLFSGFSILMKKAQSSEDATIQPSNGVLVFVGVLTGAVSALSGAGGAVIVMPLLVTMGVETKCAIGIALFDSIFVSLPSAVIYTANSTTWNFPCLFLSVTFHLLFTYLGTMVARRVSSVHIKKIVGFFSVAIAVYMLGTLAVGT